MKRSTPLDRLKHHVTGAIERGEKTAISNREKFDGSVDQLLDNEIIFDCKVVLESLFQALPRAVLVEHLEWISDVEDWRFKINSRGEIYDSEKDNGE